jgi:hypothetical protein
MREYMSTACLLSPMRDTVSSACTPPGSGPGYAGTRIGEYRHLHAQARSLVREVQPDVRSTVISASEVALQPAGSIDGVLAVHADVLRAPDVRQPLLAMAHSVDPLVLARHDDSDTTLDALATPALVLRLCDLMPLPPARIRSPCGGRPPMWRRVSSGSSGSSTGESRATADR